MRIDQVLVSAAPGDAVTNLAMTLRQLFPAKIRSDIFALYFDQQLARDVRPLKEYAKRPGARSARDLLIFHLSIGEPDLAAFLRQRSERMAVIYHNISPAEPFRPYDPGFADLLDEGRRELVELHARTAAAFTVSAFNAEELRDAGYRDITVLPLVVDPESLGPVPAETPVPVHPDRPGPGRPAAEECGPLIISVGQVLPHKRPDFLLEAFHILSTYLVKDARLAVIGPDRLPAYRAALQTQIDELQLERARLTGAVPRAELAEFFRTASVFATASEHEGFCVPLLEAMSFDLPILARRFAAIPETAGPAGLLLDQADGPEVAAEALATLLGDHDLRRQLVTRGRARLRDFDPNRAKASWRDALLALG